MGTPVPIEPPVIDAEQEYQVWVDAWESEAPDWGCTGNYLGRGYCYLPGSEIIYWLSVIEGECKDGFELCQLVGYSAQRLIYLHPV